jgi:hypothetical protein
VPAGYQFAAGCLFTAAGLLFLYQAFKVTTHGPGQRDIIHFVCAFCAGAAGAFFTGSALLAFNVDIGTTGKLAFQGTAGIALFGLVFTIFRFRYNETRPSPPDGSWVSPSGQNPFSQVAEAIAGEIGATVDLSVLTPEEKKATPHGEQLDVSTVALATKALLRLREMAKPAVIREYKVDYDAAIKEFKIII